MAVVKTENLQCVARAAGVLLMLSLFGVLAVRGEARAQALPYRGLLRNIAERPTDETSSHPRGFVTTSSGVFFLAASGELWFTDGTRNATARVPMVTPEGFLEITPSKLVPYGKTVAFASSFYDPTGSVGCSSARGEGCSSQGVFLVNSTKTGVTLVREKLFVRNEYTTKRNTGRIFDLGGKLAFFADEQHSYGYGENYSQLWASDGTRQGTQLIYKLQVDDDKLYERVAHNSQLYFVAVNITPSFYGLWRSNGTTTGTKVISENYCAGLISYSGRLFFLELKNFTWYLSVLTADGNSIEKSVPLSMTPTARDSDPVFIGAAGRLYFLAAGSASSLRNIWSVDPATLEMTKVASDVFEPTDVVGFNDTLYFVSSRNDVGRELFKINGSEVALAHDIRPGISSSFPSDLTVLAGELFLSADDGNSGREIWRVHGASGSQLSLAEDIWPGLNSSVPDYLNPTGTFLLFSADDGLTGIEPWIFSKNPLGQFPTPTPTVTPTATPTATPRATATPQTGGIASNTKPSVQAYATTGSSGLRIKLSYKVSYDGLTREIVSVYRRAYSSLVYRGQTQLGRATKAGRLVSVYLPARRLKRGRYQWCVASASSFGVSSSPACAALVVR